MRSMCAAVLLASAPTAALAQSWSAGLTASASQADGDNAPLIGSGSLSLERSFTNGTWAGAAVGTSSGETIVPEIDAAIDQSSVDAAIWWGAALGSYQITLEASYIDQKLDGGFSLPGVAVNVEGDVRTLGGAATLARTFGERSTLTPSLQLSYAETDADYALSAGTGGLAIEENASGVTASARLDGATPLSESVAFIGGVGFIATDEAAAQAYTRGGQAAQRQDEGAAQWGEAYVGAEFAVGEASTLSAQIGSTIGREQEEAFASISLGWRF